MGREEWEGCCTVGMQASKPFPTNSLTEGHRPSLASDRPPKLQSFPIFTPSPLHEDQSWWCGYKQEEKVCVQGRIKNMRFGDKRLRPELYPFLPCDLEHGTSLL